MIICCLTVNLSVNFTTDLAQSYSVHALKCLFSSGSFQAKGPISNNNKVVKGIGIGEQILLLLQSCNSGLLKKSPPGCDYHVGIIVDKIL